MVCSCTVESDCLRLSVDLLREELDFFRAGKFKRVKEKSPLASPVIESPKVLNDIFVELHQSQLHCPTEEEIINSEVTIYAGCFILIVVCESKVQGKFEIVQDGISGKLNQPLNIQLE